MPFLSKKLQIHDALLLTTTAATEGIGKQYKAETWPVQNENTSIQYPVWFSNTEVSVSVFNLKNTE